MSGKFSFLSAKEALGQRKAENKCKRMMPDTSVVDDHLTAGSSVPAGSTEPSLAKFLRKTKSSEVEGFMTMKLPSNRSTYFDPSFIKGVVETLLLLADHKRFVDLKTV